MQTFVRPGLVAALAALLVSACQRQPPQERIDTAHRPSPVPQIDQIPKNPVGFATDGSVAWTGAEASGGKFRLFRFEPNAKPTDSRIRDLAPDLGSLPKYLVNVDKDAAAFVAEDTSGKSTLWLCVGRSIAPIPLELGSRVHALASAGDGVLHAIATDARGKSHFLRLVSGQWQTLAETDLVSQALELGAVLDGRPTYAVSTETGWESRTFDGTTVVRHPIGDQPLRLDRVAGKVVALSQAARTIVDDRSSAPVDAAGLRDQGRVAAANLTIHKVITFRGDDYAVATSGTSLGLYLDNLTEWKLVTEIGNNLGTPSMIAATTAFVNIVTKVPDNDDHVRFYCVEANGKAPYYAVPLCSKFPHAPLFLGVAGDQVLFRMEGADGSPTVFHWWID